MRQLFHGQQLASATDTLEQDLLRLVTRIETVLTDERRLLDQDLADEFDRVIARKNQLALEAVRLSQQARGQVFGQQARRKLAETARLLMGNSDLLKRHIDAVSEIAARINAVCNEATSDGTYTSDVARQGRRQ